MVGGIFAALLADAMTPGPLAVNVGLGKGTNRAQGLFLEAFASAILTMAVLMIAVGE
jgi:aquaporin related protein